jgi:glycosyltransferase involved in cell wall biosynthesis
MNKLQFLVSFNKTKLKEFLRYDLNFIKAFFVICIYVKCRYFVFRKRYYDAASLLSTLFKTGWPGSFERAKTLQLAILNDLPVNELAQYYAGIMASVKPMDNTQKFFTDPSLFLKGIFIVVRESTPSQKGVLIVKYSYYFALLFKLFDTKTISERYHIVLEPSWAGFCDPSILLYTNLSEPVFVMTYENRDRRFIEALDTNLVPVDIGPNWWVNHEMFDIQSKQLRDIDIVSVASWSEFKRHSFLFTALKKLKNEGHDLKAVMVGYPGDMTLDDIKAQAKFCGVEDCVEFYEWLSPEGVSDILKRSKVNVLWSRFEGNNRAIIEGMFCDSPCIMRKGHNYGESYDYINELTGVFSDERDLPQNIINIVQGDSKFSPREYVLENHNCIRATEILAQEIAKFDDIDSSNVFAVKINHLHGMKYFRENERERFKADYDLLTSLIA